MTEARTIRAGEVAGVGRVLAAAFRDDPLMRWVFASAPDRVVALQRFWGDIAQRSARTGAELWRSDSGSTAAIWYPPRPAGVRDGDQPSDDAMALLLREIVGERTDEVLDAFALIASMHPSNPCWYLSAVGTEPSQQGSGAGAAVLAPVLARCDGDGVGAYLESTNPRNLQFYERLGFTAIAERSVGDEPALITAMWRPPPVTLRDRV